MLIKKNCINFNISIVIEDLGPLWTSGSQAYISVCFELFLSLIRLFARDITAAMLVITNKSISIFWEQNSIFIELKSKRLLQRLIKQREKG